MKKFPKHDVTPAERDRMLAAQGGKCALCRQPITSKPCVDHDHETGFVRGVVHGKCNSILGMADDDPDLLEDAAHYLRQHVKKHEILAAITPDNSLALD